MGDKGKTKKQLLQEIQRLRQEIDRLKASHHRDLFPAGPAANGEEQIGELGDLLSQILFEADLQGHVLYANAAGFEVTGYTREDFKKGINLFQLFPEQDRQRVALDIKKVLEGEEFSDHEYTVVRKDGSTFPAIIYSSPIYENDQPVGVRGIAVDISEHREAETQLQTLSSVVEQSESLIAIINLQEEVEYANPAFLARSNLGKDGLVGLSWRSFVSEGSSLIQQFQDIYDTVLVKGKTWRGEVEDRTGDGKSAWREAKIFPIKDDKGNIIHFVYMSDDITHRREAEEALKKSKAEYQQMFELSPEAIVKLDTKGRFLDANKKLYDMVGATPKEFIGKSFMELPYLTQTGKEQVREMFLRRVKGENIPAYNIEMITKRGEKKIGRIIATQLKNEAGEIIHELAIISDITKQHKAKKELQESEEMYKSMFELSPQTIVMLDRNGTLLEANEKLYEMFGGTSEEIIGKSFMNSPYLPEESQAKVVESFRKRIKGDSISPYEVEILTRSGERRIGRIMGTLIRDLKGEIIRTLIMLSDITEQRWRENLTRQQRDLALSLSVSTNLKEVFSHCVDTALAVSDMDCSGIYLMDQHSGNLDLVYHQGLSAAFVRSTKRYFEGDPFTRMVMKGKPLYTTHSDLIIPTTKAVNKKEAIRALAIIPIQYQQEVIACLNVGSHMFDDISEPVCSALETIAAQMGEVIYRIRIEAAIRTSEERYRTLQENIPFAVFRTTPGGKIKSANPAMAAMFGFDSATDLLFISVEEFYVIPGRRKKMLEQLRKWQAVSNFEVELKRKGGATFWGSLNIKAVLDQRGKISHLDGILEDISARKQAEEALKESEERYRLLIKNIPSVSWATSQTGQTVFISPNVGKIYGFTAEEIYARGKELWFDRIYPDDISYVQEKFNRLFSRNESYDIEYRIKRKDGQWIWLHDQADTYLEKDGVKYAYGVFSDISERKKSAEAILRAKEEWERTFDVVPELIFLVDEEHTIVRVNRSLANRLGVHPRELVGQKCYKVIHGTDTPPNHCPHKQLIKDGKEHSVETHEEKLGGDFIITTSPWYNAEGRIIGSVNTAVDISERKWAENLLEKQRDLARSLSVTTSLNEALALCLEAAIEVAGMDSGGVYLVDNETGGLDLVHAKGLSRKFIESTGHYDATAANTHLVMAGKPVYQDYSQIIQAIKDPIRQNEDLHILAVLPVLDQGEVVACLNIASHSVDQFSTSARHALETLAANMGEVIVRIRAEEKLQTTMNKLQALTYHLQDVREEERIQIARELHDELSSMLTVLKMSVVRISDQLIHKETKEFREIIKKTQSMEEMINKSVSLVRSMITRLRPAILDDLGLIAAIEWLVEEFQEDSRIQCVLDSNLEKLELAADESTAIFRILQEILFNAARHAAATKISINLSKTKRSFQLKVEDNGRGIQQQDLHKKKSFGILGMRERANLFSWSFNIDGTEGKGTHVLLTVPLES